jgi:hypothetical protein
MNTLGNNGLIGLIGLMATVIFIGQYFLAYNLYNFFKKHHDKYQPL